MIKNHILKIKFLNKENKDCGTFEFEDEKPYIKIYKRKDYKDTLIHELTHFILALTTGKWFSHGKKFNKLYKAIKEL